MAIDYVTLMLVNMAAGLFVLSFYLFGGMQVEYNRGWAVGFGMSGLVALLTGLHMTLVWPLQGAFNIAFGEMSVLFGVALLAIGACVWFNAALGAVGVYTFVAGVAAIVIGANIIVQELTNWPLVAGIGFILSGSVGVLLGPSAATSRSRILPIITGVVAIVAAVIWAMIGYYGYWMHMQMFTDWQPATVVTRQAQQGPDGREPPRRQQAPAPQDAPQQE